MSEAPTILLALLAGVVLGTIFYGGLWWTIQKGCASELPAVWFSASFLVRTACAVAGFYFVSHGDWRRLTSCLLGFLVARVLVTRFTRLPRERRTQTLDHDGAR